MHPVLLSVHVLVLLLAIQPSLAQSPVPPETNLYSDNDGSYSSINLTTNIIFFLVVLILLLIFIISLHRCHHARVMAARMENEVIQSEISYGLDPSLLRSFPIVKYSNSKGRKDVKVPVECTVCLSEYTDSDILRVLPGCNHVFHQYCIDKWLASHTTCPICRSDLTYTVWLVRNSHVIHMEDGSEISYLTESSGNLSGTEGGLWQSESGAPSRADSFDLRLQEKVQRTIVDAPDVVIPVAS